MQVLKLYMHPLQQTLQYIYWWSDLQYVCVCPPEDDQKEKSLSHHTIQQLIMEKDQALADLNSVEKSLADLFRRYEKMKDVLEGFRKVTNTQIIHN